MNTVAKPRSRGKRIAIWSGGLLLAAMTAAGAIYGRDLVGLIQVGQQVDTIAQEQALIGGAWPRATDACMYCHGENGNARSQTYPRLAGQPEAYIKKQLKAFASGERGDPTMTPLALSMPERELDLFAAHFAKMAPLPNTTFVADAARTARGEALARAGNCVACHGERLEGKGEFPRLAGQGYDYLRDQLAQFKNGARRDAAMAAVAGRLSPQDIDDLAQYIASR